MDKEVRKAAKIIIITRMRGGYTSEEIFDTLIHLGFGYRKSEFLEDYKRIKKAINKK